MSHYQRPVVWIGVISTLLLMLAYKIQAQPITASAEDSAAVTVAALLPLSGSAAEQGEWIRSGLELGLAEANKNLEIDVKLVVEETRADPKVAISAYRALQSSRHIPVVFTYGSGVGIALSPLVNADKVVQFGLATSSPAYRSPDDYTFRNFPSAELEAAFLVDFVLNRYQAQQIAIIRIENEYGVGSAKAFRAEYEKRGGQVLDEESLVPNGSDFRSELLRVKAKQPKLIYLSAYPAEGALALRQAREIGIKAQFIASTAILGSKTFVEIAGDGAEGLLVSSSAPVYMTSKEPAIIKFIAAYKAKFGSTPGIQEIFAARAYDAALITALAIKHCGDDATCIKDQLFKVENYSGASGTITFDRFGDVTDSFTLQRLSHGEFSNAE